MCGIVGSSSHTQGACRPLVNGLRPVAVELEARSRRFAIIPACKRKEVT